MPALASRRLAIVTGFFVMVSLLLGTRLFFIQVVEGEAYRERADRQYTQGSEAVFDRGEIFFREKTGTLVSAATIKTGFLLAINPRVLGSATTTYAALSAIVAIDEEIFLAKATKVYDPYEEIASRLSSEQAEQIRSLSLPGIILVRDRWRFYPGARRASHAIGFVGYLNDIRAGRYGLERSYEEILARRGARGSKNFFVEIFDRIRPLVGSTASREGNLVLTIEPKVEAVLEEQLRTLLKNWNSDKVGGIIMNPKTGAVYAIAGMPDFDPNNFQTETSSSVFTNPVVENVYELGSVIKPIIMAAALDAGVVTAKTTYEDKGSIEVGPATIRNFDLKVRGVQTMQEVLSKSLNTGMVFVAQRLGKERLRKYVLSFGIGSETGIDLPGEVPGFVKNLDAKGEVEFATASFGHGIALTPIAAARAFSALGNGGYLPGPYLVEQIDYELGGKKMHYPDEERAVISKSTSEEITRMLVVVADQLSGGKLKFPHHSIAAKTGTAQIPAPGGGYYPDRYLHSLFGYFPAYNPEFLVFLFNVYPKGATFAAETLTSPFLDITEFLLNYYEIPPDR